MIHHMADIHCVKCKHTTPIALGLAYAIVCKCGEVIVLGEPDEDDSCKEGECDLCFGHEDDKRPLVHEGKA